MQLGDAPRDLFAAQMLLSSPGSDPLRRSAWISLLFMDAILGEAAARDARNLGPVPTALSGITARVGAWLEDPDSHEQVWPHALPARLVKGIHGSLRQLAQAPNKRLVRDHKMMQPSRVRELDQKAMRYLSKLPGRNIREKIGGREKILAVKRVYSYDLQENRLLRRLCKDLGYLIEPMLELGSQHAREEVEHRHRSVISQFRDTPLHEVRCEIPITPNNVLINHACYGQLWKAWLLLGNARDTLEQVWDRALFEQHLTSLLFLGALSKLTSFPGVRMPYTLARVCLLEDGGLALANYTGPGGWKPLEQVNLIDARGENLLVMIDQGKVVIEGACARRSCEAKIAGAGSGDCRGLEVEFSVGKTKTLTNADLEGWRVMISDMRLEDFDVAGSRPSTATATAASLGVDLSLTRWTLESEESVSLAPPRIVHAHIGEEGAGVREQLRSVLAPNEYVPLGREWALTYQPLWHRHAFSPGMATDLVAELGERMRGASSRNLTVHAIGDRTAGAERRIARALAKAVPEMGNRTMETWRSVAGAFGIDRSEKEVKPGTLLLVADTDGAALSVTPLIYRVDEDGEAYWERRPALPPLEGDEHATTRALTRGYLRELFPKLGHREIARLDDAGVFGELLEQGVARRPLDTDEGVRWCTLEHDRELFTRHCNQWGARVYTQLQETLDRPALKRLRGACPRTEVLLLGVGFQSLRQSDQAAEGETGVVENVIRREGGRWFGFIAPTAGGDNLYFDSRSVPANSGPPPRNLPVCFRSIPDRQGARAVDVCPWVTSAASQLDSVHGGTVHWDDANLVARGARIVGEQKLEGVVCWRDWVPEIHGEFISDGAYVYKQLAGAACVIPGAEDTRRYRLQERFSFYPETPLHEVYLWSGEDRGVPLDGVHTARVLGNKGGALVASGRLEHRWGVEEDIAILFDAPGARMECEFDPDGGRYRDQALPDWQPETSWSDARRYYHRMEESSRDYEDWFQGLEYQTLQKTEAQLEDWMHGAFDRPVSCMIDQGRDLPPPVERQRQALIQLLDTMYANGQGSDKLRRTLCYLLGMLGCERPGFHDAAFRELEAELQDLDQFMKNDRQHYSTRLQTIGALLACDRYKQRWLDLVFDTMLPWSMSSESFQPTMTNKLMDALGIAARRDTSVVDAIAAHEGALEILLDILHRSLGNVLVRLSEGRELSDVLRSPLENLGVLWVELLRLQGRDDVPELLAPGSSHLVEPGRYFRRVDAILGEIGHRNRLLFPCMPIPDPPRELGQMNPVFWFLEQRMLGGRRPPAVL